MWNIKSLGKTKDGNLCRLMIVMTMALIKIN